jgi:hypothetical protein
VNQEDKILLMRGIIGLIIGSFSPFLGSFFVSGIAILVGYAVSIILIIILFKPGKKWLIFGKGTLTLFVAWFLILVTLYNTLV